MFDSVVLQPGAGFTVWVLLVPIANSDINISDPTAGTSPLNAVLGLLELDFSGFSSVNLHPHPNCLKRA